MLWTEQSPGLFKRPLSATEAGMASLLAGPGPPAREYILINCVANFKSSCLSSDVVTSVRESWKALRLLKSPDIATTFDDTNKYYNVPTSTDIEAWLTDTFVLAPEGTSVNQAVRNRQARPTYLSTCTLVPSVKQDECFKGSIILFISHWRTEAAGALKLINQILDFAEDLLEGDSAVRKALAGHVEGSEVKLLTPSLDDILMLNQSPTLEAQKRVAANVKEYYSKFPPIDFPLQGSLTAKPAHLKVHQACKSASITVSSAIHAAYLSAIWILAPPEKQHLNYASIMPASVRTRLPPDSPYRDQGCWDSARMLFLHAPPGQDLVTCARHLKEQYSRAATDQWLYSDVKQIPIEMAKPPPEGTAPMPASLPYFTTIGVLNGEVIQAEHGSITVDDLTFWADSHLPGIVLRLWTFKQRLSIQIQWNETFHSDELINETLNLLEKAVHEGIGCELIAEQRTVEAYNE